MTMDTAQPGLAAENVALDDAANAFKAHLGQIEAPPQDDKPRDERGRFASQDAPAEEDDEEIEAEPEANEAESDAENDEDTDDLEEAPDEGQPDPVAPPASWNKEDAELWASLPPAAQAKIAEREGQREAAVNQKFQEAANVRKANEALITEAANSRNHAIALIDQVASLAIPPKPPVSMLDRNSGDYNPDAYHTALAQHDGGIEILQALDQQRQQLVAQQKAEEEKSQAEAMAEIERVARPAFLADVPELTDQAKAPAMMHRLVDYAIRKGIPADTFGPGNVRNITSAELHILWEATEYRRLMAARNKVNQDPKPEPKKAQVAVKPGVATPRAAQQQAKFKGSMDRLSKSGSVEDGAAVLKHLFKGR